MSSRRNEALITRPSTGTLVTSTTSMSGSKGIAGKKFFLLALVSVIQLACWRGSSRLRSSTLSNSIPSKSSQIQIHTESTQSSTWNDSISLEKRQIPLELLDGPSIEKHQSLSQSDLENRDVQVTQDDENHSAADSVGSSSQSRFGVQNKKYKEKKKKKKEEEKKDKKHKKKKEKKEKKEHKSTSTSTITTSSTSTITTTTTHKQHPTTTSTSSTSTITSTSTATSTPTPLLPCDPLPLQLSPAKLCAHVRAHCPPSGHFDYLGFFYCQGVEQKKDPDLGSESSFESLQLSSSPSTDGNSSTRSIENGYVSILKSHKHKKGDAAPYPISRRISILRSLALAVIITWMLFLFSWVGIVASDFFCPNLSTIASRLGLNESTAGVTFLAFGNGSPDVFSTFGAMKSGSGSLAIGELLGAASFIVSVISGSMMLIKPFRVKAFPFLRDVGFFTIAVALTMTFLLDGKLRLIESLCLIGLYFAYAATVIVGSWWQERNRRKRLMIATARSEYSNSRSRTELLEEDEDDEVINPFRDDEDETQEEILKTPSKKHRFPTKSGSHEDLERQSGLLSVPSPYLTPISPTSEYDPDADPLELWQDTPSAGMRAIAGIASAVGAPASSSPAGSPLLGPSPVGSASSRSGRGGNENPLSSLGMMRSQSKFRPGANPRHSLLGAIEFRDVVRSLRAESNHSLADDRSLEIFQSRDPESFYPHHHNHPHPHYHHQRSHSQVRPKHQRSETHTHRRVAGLARPDSALEPASAYEYHSARDRSNSMGNRNFRPQVHRSKSTGNHLRSGGNGEGDHYFASFHGGDGIGTSSGSGSAEASSFASLVGSRERDAAAGTDGQSRGIDVGAATAGLDDPWREEHTANDNCEEALSPLVKPESFTNKSKSDELRLGLPKIGTHSRNISEDFLLPPNTVDHNSDHTRSPVPSIKISKSIGSDQESSPPGTPTPQPKSKMNKTPTNRSRSGSNATSKVSSSKIRSTSESTKRHLKMARRALFPSLRHFREKSWLGIVISILTAPALFALNLTLPVVDDEAERQLDLMVEGELRLEGSESNLNARKAFEDEDEDEDERIIQLGGDEESNPRITSKFIAEHEERMERVHKAENSERDREIAHTLGQLPSGEDPISPSGIKNGHSRNSSRKSNGLDLHQVVEEEEDGQSNCSDDTCSTTTSIFGEVASANSELFPIQCILAPPFCTWAIFSSSGASEKSVRNKVILAFIFGTSLATLSFLATLRARKVGGQWASKRNLVMAGNVRCGIGFIVSVMWIMTIVDEVVSILQTIGIIVGLSDAILGLTVFAVGNSLGDLVANVTIAKMGHPVMAISACFAGPLLNLLLGIGISGSWILSRPTSGPHTSILQDGIYHIDFSPTLIVSGLGLLTVLIGTLIAVPMNGFLLSRKLGTTLIAAYACIMVTNILVEIFYSEK